MTTYERVTFRPEGGRSRTMYLMNPSVVGVLGELLTGVEVDAEGTEIAPRGVDERRHFISLELVRRRTPMRIDKIYGELVEIDG